MFVTLSKDNLSDFLCMQDKLKGCFIIVDDRSFDQITGDIRKDIIRQHWSRIDLLGANLIVVRFEDVTGDFGFDEGKASTLTKAARDLFESHLGWALPKNIRDISPTMRRAINEKTFNERN